MENSTQNHDLPSQDGQNGQAQAASSQNQNNESRNESLAPRPPQLLPGYHEVTLTHSSPFRPDLTECPICLLELTPIQETLTHSNGTCNRSFHQDCWEIWIADYGTCVNCRARLRGSPWGVTIQAVDRDFHARDRFQNLAHRARHNRQNLTGQELLEYHVTWVLARSHRRLARQPSITTFPSPFGEKDVLRLWFARRRPEFRSTGGIATRWQDLVQYGGPHTTETRPIIAQFQDIRQAFGQLIRVLTRVRGRNLTRAIFDPADSGLSVWQQEVAPRLQNETTNEVTCTIRRWTLAFDQAVHLENWLDGEEEVRSIWERLVARLDLRLNQQWRRI